VFSALLRWLLFQLLHVFLVSKTKKARSLRASQQQPDGLVVVVVVVVVVFSRRKRGALLFATQISAKERDIGNI